MTISQELFLDILRGRYGAVTIAEVAKLSRCPVEETEYLFASLSRQGILHQVEKGKWRATNQITKWVQDGWIAATSKTKLAWDASKGEWNGAFENMTHEQRVEEILERMFKLPPIKNKNLRVGRNRSVRGRP